MPELDDSFAFGPGGTGGSGPRAEVPAPAMGRPRTALMLIVALVLALLGFVAWWVLGRPGSVPGGTDVATGLSGSDVVTAPAVGETVATFLRDGHPVFVVDHEDGSLSVVDAFSTDAPFGIGYMVGWCESSRTFDDLHGGAKFDETGRYVLGPAPTGLATYAASLLVGEPIRVRVGAIQPPAPRTDGGGPLEGSLCTSGADTVLHRFPRSSFTASPQYAVTAPAGRWMAVVGSLLVTSDQTPRLCASVDASAGPSCSRGAPVAGVDGPGLLGANSTYVSDPSVWLVRTDGTRLTDLTLAPGGPAG